MKSAPSQTRPARRFLLSLIVALSVTLLLIAAAASAPGDGYGATIAPTAAKPSTSRSFTIKIANQKTSSSAANNAHVTAPAGYVLDAATLTATTSKAGSCSAASWTVTATAATSTIDAVAPPAAASELCPGGTLKLTFKATTPAAEGKYTWKTALFRDTTAFSRQGDDPSVTVDGTKPPAPSISTKPPNPSNTSGATFAFSDGDASAMLQCRLDSAAFAACTSPKSYTGLAEGLHTFVVRAVDPAGNQSAKTSYPWTIDLTPPPPPALSSKPPSVTALTSASFSFTDGDSTVGYFCRLDGAAFAACTSPKSYPGPLAAGSHQFQVKSRDPAGNESTVATYGWAIDLTNPVVTIDPTTEPPDPTNQTSAGFAFTSNKPGSTFACRLDGADFSTCVSRVTYSGLADGAHSFAVKATDGVGNTGPATVWNWTVDTIAPSAPSITAAPRDPTNVRTASLSFSGGEPGRRFACGLDGGAPAACSSPVSYPALADGTHVFVVRPTDAAGNTGPSANRTWVVDTVPPKTSIVGRPRTSSRSASATFRFTSSEARSTFACSLDGTAFGPRSSPRSYGKMSDGAHTFRVRATDPAGNTDPTPPSFSWRVATADTTPPSSVRRLKRTVSYRFLKLGWSLAKSSDFDHVQILRSRHRTGGAQTVVYAGRGRSYADMRFENGTYYRYTVRDFDRAGNASRPVRVAVSPGALLQRPRDGGSVKAPPLLRSAGVPRATYYNVQVYLGTRKLLSAWPIAPG